MAPPGHVSLLGPSDVLSVATAPLKSSAITQVHEITDSAPSQPYTRVLDPAFVTQDFDALRFSAAARNQLLSTASAQNQLPSTASSPSPPSPDPETTNLPPTYSTNLISSPYNSPGHYLDLTLLPAPSRLLALALTALQPTRPDYATAPYPTSLNFPTILTLLRTLLHRSSTPWPQTSFYVVSFHSTLRPGVDQAWLGELDAAAHREACASGGLLKYWFGKADLHGDRRNLATCFWETREDASRGGKGPVHQRAREAGAEVYERIKFGTWRFTVLEGAGGWRLEEWK
ncbi:hypothetical protein EJ07DRAFT_135512 [Lizonia empirigonia]|nr:hypothetical protein EJ07DRAFT_135512 [Lizonia empirigonia]